MKRTVIQINEELCNGCGSCVKGCHEGALQIIDGKAVLISDLYCDGLGACIGDCPVGAIKLEEREAEPYNEIAVMDRIINKGETAINAHLTHLKNHGETGLYNQGVEYLKANNINFNISTPIACGCPNSKEQNFKQTETENSTQVSQLKHFPIQLHLVNPTAEFLSNSDILVAADCTAFASCDFHTKFLKGKSLLIACPKLDSRIENYVEKLTFMIDEAKVNTITVLIMEVPCCGGLLKIVNSAQQKASRNVPIKAIVLSVHGNVLDENWI